LLLSSKSCLRDRQLPLLSSEKWPPHGEKFPLSPPSVVNAPPPSSSPFKNATWSAAEARPYAAGYFSRVTYCLFMRKCPAGRYEKSVNEVMDYLQRHPEVLVKMIGHVETTSVAEVPPPPPPTPHPPQFATPHCKLSKLAPLESPCSCWVSVADSEQLCVVGNQMTIGLHCLPQIIVKSKNRCGPFARVVSSISMHTIKGGGRGCILGAYVRTNKLYASLGCPSVGVNVAQRVAREVLRNAGEIRGLTDVDTHGAQNATRHPSPDVDQRRCGSRCCCDFWGRMRPTWGS